MTNWANWSDWIAGGVIGFLIGNAPWVIRWLSYNLKTKRPVRKFWGPLLKGRLSIITAAGEREPVIRSQVFDFLATADAEVLFQKTFAGKHKRYTCQERTHDILNKNLLLVGGPIANSVTKDVLDTLCLRYTFRVNNIIDTDNPEFIRQAGMENGKVVQDYGIITRCVNPYKRSNKAIIVMGCYGWGTYGALKTLLDVKNLKFLLDKKAQCYQVLVSVNVDSCMQPQDPVLGKDTFTVIKG